MKVERNVRQRRAAGKKWRPAALILAAVLVFLSLPLTGGNVFAADSESGEAVQKGSLKIVPGSADLMQDMSEAGLVIDIYRIADAKSVSGYDTYEWEPTKPFESLTIPNSPDTTNADWSSTAQSAAKLVLGAPRTGETEWDPSDTASGVQAAEPQVFYSVIDISKSFGDSTKPELPAGMYMILARGNGIKKYAVTVSSEDGTETGKIGTIANTKNYSYIFEPELITIPTKAPETWEGETEERRNTANSGPWDFNPVVTLKPQQKERKGDLKITKILDDYEARTITAFEDGQRSQVFDNVTFVFKVTGYESKESYESDNPVKTYEDYVSITFDGANSKSALVSGLPIGTYVKVEEAYSGKKYTSYVDQFETIKAPEEGKNDPVEVTFKNKYDDKPGGGGSVTNKFSYVEGSESSKWSLMGADDNSEGASEHTVPGRPEDKKDNN